VSRLGADSRQLDEPQDGLLMQLHLLRRHSAQFLNLSVD
jgi:hypothetical protein